MIVTHESSVFFDQENKDCWVTDLEIDSVEKT